MGNLSLGELVTSIEENKQVILIDEFAQTSSTINTYETEINRNSPTITIRTERPWTDAMATITLRERSLLES